LKHRLFVAIDLPIELRTQVVDLQQKLAKQNMPVDWEEPNKLHMTLNFLGEVENEKLHQVSQIIRKSISAFRPFNIQPSFLETLYKRHDPSLVYLGLSGDVEILKELQESLTKELNDLKLPQPEKFLPHITIGRLKRTDPPTTKKFLDGVSNFDFSPLPVFEVLEVWLFKSLVSKAGSHYDRLLHFSLES